jgi:hypothetical protein
MSPQPQDIAVVASTLPELARSNSLSSHSQDEEKGSASSSHQLDESKETVLVAAGGEVASPFDGEYVSSVLPPRPPPESLLDSTDYLTMHRTPP